MRKFTGFEYVQIAAANAYGMDKLEWDERLQWFAQNEQELNKPVLDPDFLAKADKPHLLTKALMAWKHYKNKIPSNIAVSLDATASGIQVLSVISGDRKAGELVNIGSKTRRDIYTQLSSEDIPRKDLKQAILTAFYGSTAMPQIVFGHKVGQFIELMATQVRGPWQLKDFMLKLWNPSQTHHSWVMPDGFTVHIPSVVVEQKRVKLRMYQETGGIEYKNMTFKTSVIAPQEKSRAMAANITHSIDAWVARSVVWSAYQEGIRVAPIHDSFWALPNHMNRVRELYLKALVQVDKSKVLESIDAQLKALTPGSTAKTAAQLYQELGGQDMTEQIMASEYALS